MIAAVAGDNAVAAAVAAAQQTVERDTTGEVALSTNRNPGQHQSSPQENVNRIPMETALTTAKMHHNRAKKPENKASLASDTAVATKSSNNRSEDGAVSPFIHYTLHPAPTQKHAKRHNPYAFLNKFNVYYQCDSSKRQPLPRPLQSVLDYTTTLSTNLKLLVMGDSVAIQWAQALDEALGAVVTMRDETETNGKKNHKDNTTSTTSTTRQVVLRRRRRHEDLTVAGPLRGGGLVAAWRITGSNTGHCRTNRAVVGHARI
jgi:hypothetical protein